ncbi:MAG: membrane protein insertion efficiency factor YidD [Gammaproteobacteria bacterium]|nr:MAG: membrane protein insertion efficiency factor YidD [Gammaproteobacteria bacterium]
MKQIIVGIIRLYQRTISPLLGPRCCFYPTCSQFAVEAINTHGPLKGTWLAIKRISRCHPLAETGHDPVPDFVNKNKILVKD